MREKYDFKNIFKTIYLDNNSSDTLETADAQGIQGNQADPISGMPIEVQLFIQNELIDKDFRYVSDFDIRFSDITAKIDS